MTSISNRSLGSQQHGHDFKGNTFHKTLRTTMNNAKIMHPNDPSPKSSRHGSSKGSSSGSSSGSSAGSTHGSVRASPRKPIVVGGKKTKVALPIRRSTRIANQRNAHGG